MSSSDLDLTAIIVRAEKAYADIQQIAMIAGDEGVDLPKYVRQHFNYDVPALTGAVQRLKAEAAALSRQLQAADDANVELHARFQAATGAADQSEVASRG